MNKSIKTIAGVVMAVIILATCVMAVARNNVEATDVTKIEEQQGCEIEIEPEDPYEVLRSGRELKNYCVLDGYVYYCWSTGAMAPYGSLHSEGLTDIKPIYRDDSIEVVFDKETLELTYYSLGKVEFKTVLPQNTDFCGVNKYHGTIYRAGNKVYLINHVDYKYEQKLLATDVAEVVMAEYPYDHAFDSGITKYHPLFKMEDGTLKVYNMYNDELTPIEHEGGYVELRPVY